MCEVALYMVSAWYIPQFPMVLSVVYHSVVLLISTTGVVYIKSWAVLHFKISVRYLEKYLGTTKCLQYQWNLSKWPPH